MGNPFLQAAMRLDYKFFHRGSPAATIVPQTRLRSNCARWSI
jgi:hypothetical protein